MFLCGIFKVLVPNDGPAFDHLFCLLCNIISFESSGSHFSRATNDNTMKLMIVGIQGIGKTSLLEGLRREGKTSNKHKNWMQRMGENVKQQDHKGETISTVGVDISDLTLGKKEKLVHFRTWDFGGQVIPSYLCIVRKILAKEI